MVAGKEGYVHMSYAEADHFDEGHPLVHRLLHILNALKEVKCTNARKKLQVILEPLFKGLGTIVLACDIP